jgi:hypothetical protein
MEKNIQDKNLTWNQILNVLRSYYSHLEKEVLKSKEKKDEHKIQYYLGLQSEVEILALMFAERLKLDHKHGVEAWKYIKKEIDDIVPI